MLAKKHIPNPKFLGFLLQILDYAGIDAPSFLHGRDLRAGDSVAWDTFFLYKFLNLRMTCQYDLRNGGHFFQTHNIHKLPRPVANLVSNERRNISRHLEIFVGANDKTTKKPVYSD